MMAVSQVAVQDRNAARPPPKLVAIPDHPLQNPSQITAQISHTTSQIDAHGRQVTFTCHRRSSRGVNDPLGERWDAASIRGRGRSRHGSVRQLLAVAPWRAAESAARSSEWSRRRGGASGGGRSSPCHVRGCRSDRQRMDGDNLETSGCPPPHRPMDGVHATPTSWLS